jgi:hypothetical protein
MPHLISRQAGSVQRPSASQLVDQGDLDDAWLWPALPDHEPVVVAGGRAVDSAEFITHDAALTLPGVFTDLVQISDVDRLTEALAGVRRTVADDLAQWRYHGRLIARQLDDDHVVIRADFDHRDELLRQFPGTFSVPARYSKHMMIVADLTRGDTGAIEDAVEAAWQL